MRTLPLRDLLGEICKEYIIKLNKLILQNTLHLTESGYFTNEYAALITLCTSTATELPVPSTRKKWPVAIKNHVGLIKIGEFSKTPVTFPFFTNTYDLTIHRNLFFYFTQT
jgi:hypothetical protein